MRFQDGGTRPRPQPGWQGRILIEVSKGRYSLQHMPGCSPRPPTCPPAPSSAHCTLWAVRAISERSHCQQTEHGYQGCSLAQSLQFHARIGAELAATSFLLSLITSFFWGWGGYGASSLLPHVDPGGQAQIPGLGSKHLCR